MVISSKDIKVYKSNHKKIKNKFEKEFMKISHKNIIFEAIKEIYMVEIDFMKGPEFEVICYPDFSYKTNIEKKIEDKFQNHWLNQGTYSWFKWCIEDLLEKYDSEHLYWYSEPSYANILRRTGDENYNHTIHLILIQFERDKYHDLFSFKGTIHPFIKELKSQIQWEYDYKSKKYDEIFRRTIGEVNKFLYDNFDHLNIISTLQYEGSANKGSLIYIEENKSNNLLVDFVKPIELKSHTEIRKLLQMTNDKYSLVINDEYKIIGIGSMNNYKNQKRIIFSGHFSWKYYDEGELVFSCIKSLPILPLNLSKEKNNSIKEKLELVFDKKYSYNNLSKIINSAKKQKHGTMLVITENAEAESERLKKSGICINPVEIDEDITQCISEIDGAILLDPFGICHQIGVILDGISSIEGDPSRGARYNSGLRYGQFLKDENVNFIIIIISEDNYIDVFTPDNKVFQ
jgi:hypothetical protein